MELDTTVQALQNSGLHRKREKLDSTPKNTQHQKLKRQFQKNWVRTPKIGVQVPRCKQWNKTQKIFARPTSIKTQPFFSTTILEDQTVTDQHPSQAERTHNKESDVTAQNVRKTKWQPRSKNQTHRFYIVGLTVITNFVVIGCQTHFKKNSFSKEYHTAATGWPQFCERFCNIRKCVFFVWTSLYKAHFESHGLTHLTVDLAFPT